MFDRPLAGVHYPGRLAVIRGWFPDDAACLDYLDWLRWRDAFVCPHCESVRSWVLRDGRHACGGCKRRVSPTAGTIFHRARTPLTVWFEAAWLMVTPKNGTSALNLQRVLGLGSYQTAWAMLHRYRDVMVIPERDKLSGEVEVDETFIGGKKPGKRGRGAAGKTMVVGAIERAPNGRKGWGRARLEVISNARGDTLRAFVVANVAPGSTVISDALSSYPVALSGTEYEHNPINVKRSGLKAHELLPGVHRLFSLTKRVLEGTHQGAVDTLHLQSYLDEFIFRFNRPTTCPRARPVLPSARAHCRGWTDHLPRHRRPAGTDRTDGRQARCPAQPGDPRGSAARPTLEEFLMHELWRRDRGAGQTPAPSSAISPLLPDLKSRLDDLLDEEDAMDAVFSEEQEQAREQAAQNFRAAGPELLAAATPYLWAYYRATAAEFTQEECTEYGIPLLEADTDIWTQVTIRNPPNIELGHTRLEPAAAYISFEGEVSWESEHGLQLVIEDGRRVCKVGPYDGHVTNAHASGDISRLGVVFDG